MRTEKHDNHWKFLEDGKTVAILSLFMALPRKLALAIVSALWKHFGFTADELDLSDGDEVPLADQPTPLPNLKPCTRCKEIKIPINLSTSLCPECEEKVKAEFSDEQGSSVAIAPPAGMGEIVVVPDTDVADMELKDEPPVTPSPAADGEIMTSAASEDLDVSGELPAPPPDLDPLATGPEKETGVELPEITDEDHARMTPDADPAALSLIEVPAPELPPAPLASPFPDGAVVAAQSLVDLEAEINQPAVEPTLETDGSKSPGQSLSDKDPRSLTGC